MPKVLSEADKSDFRQRLLSVAERNFAQHGPEGVSVRQLAQQLGCSAMTPYRYFKDKDEILAAIVIAALDRFSTTLETAFATGADAKLRSAAVRLAYVQFAFENPRAYRVIFDRPHPDMARHPDLIEAARRAEEIMTAPIELLIQHGHLAGDARLLGRIYWSAIHGAVSLELAGKLESAPGFDTVIDSMLNLISKAASPEPKGADNKKASRAPRTSSRS